jgi:hypothetical protein
MEKDRIFYANGIGFSVHGDEAVLVFKLRALEDITAAKAAQQPGTESPPVEEIEVARVHIARSLAHHLLTQMAQDYQDLIAQQSPQNVQTPQEVPDATVS